MMEAQPMQEKQLPRGRLTSCIWSPLLTATVLLVGLYIAPLARAAEDQSYQAVRNWLEQYRAVPPSFQPGEHLTIKDVDRLRPFIPQPAWEFYFYPDMDIEVAATGTYPPPADWGKNMASGYYLDEQGALIGFNGGGFPFPDIKPEDPQAAVKVFWNLYWHPGHSDYFMPMVA